MKETRVSANVRVASCHAMAWLHVPCQAICLCVMSYSFAAMSCHQYSVSCRVKIVDLGTNNTVLIGRLPPPRPPAVPQGVQPPGGGPARFWQQDIGIKILVPSSPYHNLASGSCCVSCRINTFRVKKFCVVSRQNSVCPRVPDMSWPP